MSTDLLLRQILRSEKRSLDVEEASDDEIFEEEDTGDETGELDDSDAEDGNGEQEGSLTEEDEEAKIDVKEPDIIDSVSQNNDIDPDVEIIKEEKLNEMPEGAMFAKYIGSGTEIVALSEPVTMGVNVFGQLFSFIDKDSVERTAFYVWGTDGAAEICSYQLRDSDNNLLNNYYNNSELNVSEGIVIENGIKNIGRNAFYRGKAKWVVLPETLEKLDYGAFYDQSLIETINLQECLALTEIGDYAFNYNAKLDGIVIPDSVVKIGEGAFDRCESLTHINLPKNLVDLGNNAFVNCKMLVSDETDPLVIPKTIQKCYTNGAFSGCPLITAVKLEDGMTEVVNNCLAKLSYITEISIPSTVTKIGETAFNGCSSLAVINLNGAQIESVGSQAFKDCKALGSFELPDSLKTLGGSAFYGCEMLKSIDIPDGICSLDGVFEGCISLRSVRLPSDIMTLDNTFNGCTSLERIDLPNSLRRIGRNTFKNTGNINTMMELIKVEETINRTAEQNESNKVKRDILKKQ